MKLILEAAVDRRERGALTSERIEAVPQPLEQRCAVSSRVLGHYANSCSNAVSSQPLRRAR